MDGIRPVKPGAGARTPTNGFVIPKIIIAEYQIVHGALAAGSESESLEQSIRETLADFCVTTHHCRCV